VPKESWCESPLQRRVFMRVSLWKKRISLIFATFVNPWGATKTPKSWTSSYIPEPLRTRRGYSFSMTCEEAQSERV
jgi:hypothetical protein